MKAQKRLLELDCLRGIAAIMVVFFHLTMGGEFSKYGFNIGITGVDLFFMISGFVIFLTIEKTKTYNDFLWSRFARLFPTYWVCVTITTILIVGWKIIVKMTVNFPNITDYLANLTMMQYWFGVKDIDGPYWTLSIELLFYAFILSIFLSKSLKRIELISFLLVIIIVLIKFLSIPTYNQLSNYIPLINYTPLFFSGIIFYKIKFQKKQLYQLLLPLFYLSIQAFVLGGRDKSFVSNMQYCIAISCYFIVFYLYCYNCLGFIVNRISLFLGRISYSLYLIHQYIAVNLLLPLFTHSKYFHFSFWPVALLIVLPSIIVIATIINKFIEVPSTRFVKNRILNNKPQL